MSPRRAWAIAATLLTLVGAFVVMAAGAPLAGCYQCDYPCPSAFDVGPYCLTPSGSNQASTCLIDGQPVTQCVPGSCPAWTLPSSATLTLPMASLWSTLGPRDNLHWFIACLPPGSVPAASAVDSSAQGLSVAESSIDDASSQDASVEGSAAEDALMDAGTNVDASTAFISAVPGMAGALTILFDGVPAEGCVCTPNTQITCANVPPSIQTIEFRYVQSPPSLLDAGSDDASDDADEADGGADAGISSIPLSIAFDVGNCQPTHVGCPLSFVPEASTN